MSEPADTIQAPRAARDALDRDALRNAVGRWYIHRDLAPLRAILAHPAAWKDGYRSLLEALGQVLAVEPSLGPMTAGMRLTSCDRQLLDELLEEAIGGTAAGGVLESYEAEPSEASIEGNEPADGSRTDAAAIACWVIEERKEPFARDGGGKLYAFEGGVYRSNGSRRVRTAVKRYFVEMGLAHKWSSHKAQQVTEYLEADAPELLEAPPLDKLNVRNGILDLRRFLETGNKEDISLVVHTPDHLSTIQLPILYDPEVGCPAWERQVDATFPEDARDLAWEIPSWLMVPCTSIQRAILFLGEGGTGKSTYLMAVRNFLGRQNVVTKTLHRLESNRFSAAGLFGKLANICADLPSQDLAGTAMFKAITGGDEITGEHKFLNELSFVPYARLIFSANRPPRSNDPSEAFFERWIVVPFDKKFRGQANEVPRHKLDASLCQPGELSGVLNKALAVLPKVLDRGFTVSESMREAHRSFRETTDPVLVWIHTSVVDHPTAFISKEDLLAAYNRFAASKGRPVETQKSFTQTLQRWNPRLREGQRRWKGKPKAHCWLGVGLRGDLPPGVAEGSPREGKRSQGSQDSQGYSQLSNRATTPDGGVETAPGREAGERTMEEGVNPVNPVTGSLVDLQGDGREGNHPPASGAAEALRQASEYRQSRPQPPPRAASLLAEEESEVLQDAPKEAGPVGGGDAEAST